MTQPLDLDPIEARRAAASKGPWRLSEDFNDIHSSDGDHLASYWHTADGEFIVQAPEDVDAMAAEIRRLRARTLTESEHNRAWHAIEGAAGEEGADPGTVLNAVLRALGINPPAEETPGVADDSNDPEPYRFVDADGDYLHIGIPASPACGGPAISFNTATEPVHVPADRIDGLIATLHRLKAAAVSAAARP